jgi:transglutaminase-like putative cysteine protease
MTGTDQQTDVAPAVEAEPAPPSPPLYVASYGVTLCALYTAYVGLDMGDPAFILVVWALSTVGFVVSYLARSKPTAGWSAAALAGVLVGLVALRSMAGGGSGLLYPPAAEGAVHVSLGVFMCWLLVILSFALLSAGWLLFMCVPTAAIMGLVGTSNTDPAMFWAFLIFVLLAVFMLVHEHLNSALSVHRDGSEVAVPTLRLAMQAITAVVCVVGALIVGNVGAIPLKQIASFVGIEVASGMPQGSNRSLQGPGGRNLRIIELTEMPVGQRPPDNPDLVVMRVRAAHAAYWRGATYDTYTGAGWRNSVPARTYVGTPRTVSTPTPTGRISTRFSLDIQVPRTAHNAVPGPSYVMPQLFILEMGIPFTQLYGATEPLSYQVHMLQPRAEWIRALADRSGNVTFTGTVAGIVYSVRSRIAKTSPDMLRRIRARMNGARQQLYTDVRTDPVDKEDLRNLAQKVAGRAPTDYDKVMALKDYLANTCVYSLEPPPAPTRKDVVADFVFSRKQGWCDAFATSLAVLCRMMGIPTRLVSGFAPGTFNAETREYIVRAGDKHVWTEVWFEGVGWVPFEATDGAGSTSDTASTQGLEALRSWWSEALKRGKLSLALWGAAGLMLLLALANEIWGRRERRLTARKGGSNGCAAEVLDLYGYLNRRLAKPFLHREPSETPAEHAAYLGGILAGAGVHCGELEELVGLVERARYAGDPLSAEDVARARVCVDTILKVVKEARVSGDIARATKKGMAWER